MFNLDDNFLKRLGLGELPFATKNELLKHVYDTLELRVGTALSNGLSDEQLDQFEKIIDKDGAVVAEWLEVNMPEYEEDIIFQRMAVALGLETDDPALICEYCATKWLELNRPDYREIVRSITQDLESEISANRDAILGR